jgi:antagonist of KipI
VRVVAGPQADLLDDAGWRRLLGTGLVVSAAADRVGYRLAGVAITASSGASTLPSEPGCPGAIQLPPGGDPIVLMADAPTVGGYPKPAVVCSADLGRLAQHPTGAAVRFTLVAVDEAQRLYRRQRVAIHTLQQLRGAGSE